MYLRCRGETVQIVTGKGKESRIETVKTIPPGAPRGTVDLSSEQVRACFEGRTTDRALAVAALREVQFGLLFGGSRYVAGWRLRTIGRALRSEHVREALADYPIDALLVAAKYREPEEQIARGIAAALGRAI